MALREGECFYVRRVADRGIDKNIGGSRTRGDGVNRDRRFAGRGNEIGDRDPRDFEIKRLKRRVRDLELQQEIKWLRQRVRHLELQQDTIQTETESSTIVRDEGDNGEQQPFSHYPHWVFEPTYLDFPSEGEPRFDEDEFVVDEKEYRLVTMILNGVQEDEPAKRKDNNNHKTTMVSSGKYIQSLKVKTVMDRGLLDVTCGRDNDALRLVTLTNKANIFGNLNYSSFSGNIPTIAKIQNDGIIINDFVSKGIVVGQIKEGYNLQTTRVRNKLLYLVSDLNVRRTDTIQENSAQFEVIGPSQGLTTHEKEIGLSDGLAQDQVSIELSNGPMATNEVAIAKKITFGSIALACNIPPTHPNPCSKVASPKPKFKCDNFLSLDNQESHDDFFVGKRRVDILFEPGGLSSKFSRLEVESFPTRGV